MITKQLPDQFSFFKRMAIFLKLIEIRPVPVLIKVCLLMLISTSSFLAVVPTATFSASGSTTLCVGTNVVFTAASGAGYTYQWTQGGSSIATATNITYTATTAGNYALVVTSGTDVATSSTVTVVVSPPVTPAITGNTAICSGSSSNLDAGASFTAYAWSTGATTQSVTAYVAAVYAVTVTNSYGCQGTASVTTSVVALPTPTIAGTTTFCAGGSTSLTTNPGFTYSWSTGATTQSISATTGGVQSVTVTNTSGCQGYTTVTTTVIAVPVPTITGNTNICLGGSVALSAGAVYSSYVWSSGATTQTVAVNTATSININVTNAAGCHGTATVVTSIVPLPSPSISGNTTLCANGTTTLTASAGFTAYVWSNGATTQSISVNNAAAYNVTVTNSNGCKGNTSVTTTTVTPALTVSGATAICAGSSTTLDAGAGFSSYAWSTGATTQSIITSVAAVYNVSVTNGSGCQGVVTVSTTTLSVPVPTIVGTTSLCANGATTLSTSTTFSAYIWSNSATTQSASITNAGAQTITVTATNGCQGIASVTTTTVSLPTPAISGNTAVCTGGSTTLNAGAGYASYLWSSGANTQTIAVNTATALNVNVTNAAGCHGIANVVTNVVPLPTPGITGTQTLCANGSTTLTASPGYTAYLWSNGGATTQTVNATLAAAYNVTVTNSNGCQGVASITTSTVAPTPTITGGGPLCSGSTATLDAGAGYLSYNWSTGSTSQSITTNIGATYNVTVTSSNGCQGAGSVSTSILSLPTPTISGTFTFCANGSTSITANSGYTSYAWSTGATTQSISLNTPGTYSVTVINANGCQAVASVTTSTVALPTPVISGNTLVCSNGSSILSAGAGYASYIWSTGATTSTISVNTATAVSVNVTNSSGCQGSGSAVTSVTAAPVPTITGATAFCVGGTTTLSAGAGYSSYLWSNGFVSQTIAVNNAAVYNVTVTNANGCLGITSVNTTTVALPTPVISGNMTICAGGTATLTANSGYASYLWSTGATTQSITTTTAGSYSVTVTNGTGCQGMTTASTTTVALPTPTITGATVICAGNTTTLNAGAGYASYVWSNGATSQSITTNVGAAYTVTVTTALGCQGFSTVSTSTVALPTPSITGTASFCAGTTTTLTADPGYSAYIWSSGATTPSIAVSTQGVFNVTVTTSNACKSSTSISTSTLSSPVTAITGNTTICAGGSTTLSAGAGFSSYNWSTGATTQSIVVSTSVALSVTVTNANGCTGVATASTTTVSLPIPAIVGNTVICAGSTTTLSAGAVFPGYLWSTGATTQSITTTTGGTYSLTVTNASGCQGFTTVTTATVALPTPTIVGANTFCSNAATTLSTSTAFTTYSWSTSASTRTITTTLAGAFNVTVTNSSGCVGVTSINTTTLVAPTPAVTGNTAICSGNSTTLNAGGGYTAYAWSTGATTQTISISTGAINNVTVTSVNGCQAVATVTTAILALPVPVVTGSTTICAGSTNTLNVTNSPSITAYVWSTGATTSSIAVNSPQSLTVTVTNTAGCQGFTTLSTSTVALPTPSITGTNTFCSNAITTLSATAGFPTYSWSTGSTIRTATVNTAGVFNVTVTTVNGCRGNASISTTTLVSPNPVVAGSPSYCAGTSTTLDVGPSYSTYSWTGGSSNQSITVTSPGVYNVTVTIGNSCQAVATVTAVAWALPLPVISNNTLICIGNTNTLSVNNPTYSTYAWASGETTQTITVNSPAALSVTVTDVNGCQNFTSTSTNTVALPSPTIVGTSTFCSNVSSILTVTPSAGHTFTWSTGMNTRTISVNTGAVFNVTVTNISNGCRNNTSITTTTLVSPLPVISNPTAFCAGTTATLDVGSAYTTYTWTGGSGSQSIAITSPGIYSVGVTNSNVCTAVATVTTTTLSLPVPAISGQTAICIGNTNTLSATPGFSAYAWSTSDITQTLAVNAPSSLTVIVTNSNGCQGMATINTSTVALPVPAVSGPTAICYGNTVTFSASSGYPGYAWSTGATTRTISINATGNYSVSGSFSVTVTTSLGCQGSASLATITNTLPVPSISGSPTLCATTTTTLDVGSGFSSYVWSTGAGTQSIAVGNAAVYNVTVTNPAGCFGHASATTTVYALPVISVSGQTAICIGNTNTLNVTPGYSAYVWSTGDITPSVMINSPAVLTVTVTNTRGCSSVRSATTATVSLPTPVISGNTAICGGGSTVLDAAGPGYVGYQWSTGSSNHNIVVTNTASVFNVTVTTIFGCVGSTSVATTINASPTPSISGTNTFCAGNYVTLIADPGYAGYVWSNASTSPSIVVSASGTFVVNVSDSHGCQGTGSIVTVAYPIPPAPTITQNGNDLTSSANNGNQWFNNGVAIATATNQVYTITQNGLYSVMTIENTCSSPLSAVLTVIYTGVENLSNDAMLSVYPNPAKDQIFMEGGFVNQEGIEASLYDLQGKLVGTYTDTKTIDVSALNNGMYLLTLKKGSSGTPLYRRIIIMH